MYIYFDIIFFTDTHPPLCKQESQKKNNKYVYNQK